MYFSTFIATVLLASGSTLAAPAGNAGVAPRQTYIGSVEFTDVDGNTVQSNMEVGAGYRQLSKSKFIQVAPVWAQFARNTNARIAQQHNLESWLS